MYRFAIFVAALVACGSDPGADQPVAGGSDPGADHSGGAGGVLAVGGSGGEQIPSSEATTAEECAFLGGGGADLVHCDYVTVAFSEPVPTTDLAIEVDTSFGDHLTLATSDPFDTPYLALIEESAGTATGFTIVDEAVPPHYAPADAAIVVSLAQQVIADTTIAPTYACVEVTSDDWCWKGDPVTITVAP